MVQLLVLRVMVSPALLQSWRWPVQRSGLFARAGVIQKSAKASLKRASRKSVLPGAGCQGRVGALWLQLFPAHETYCSILFVV